MRTIIRTALYLLLIITLNAYNNSDASELSPYLKALEGPIYPSYLNCNQSMDASRITDCGPQRSKLLQDQLRAGEMLKKINSRIGAYLQNPTVKSTPRLFQMASKINGILQCMDSHLASSLYLDCKKDCIERPNKTVYAYMEHYFSINRETISICKPYLMVPDINRSAMLLHEVSHLCGTDDEDFLFSEKFKALQKPSVGVKSQTNYSIFGFDILRLKQMLTGYNNADNYAYWSIYGFCLPGFDCR